MKDLGKYGSNTGWKKVWGNPAVVFTKPIFKSATQNVSKQLKETMGKKQKRVINMLSSKEYQQKRKHKNKELDILELKSTITVMKKWIDGINSTIQNVEESAFLKMGQLRLCSLRNDRKMKKYERNLRNPWGTIKHANQHDISEGEVRERNWKTISITSGWKLSNLMKNMNIHM